MKSCLFILLPVVAVFFSLQLTCEYHYYLLEQYSLFLYTYDFFLERVSEPGGLSLWFSEAFNQFFYYPYAGAAIYTFLFLAVTVYTTLIANVLMRRRVYSVLCFLPAVSLYAASLDVNTQLQYSVAFLSMLMCLHLYLLLPEKRYKAVASGLLCLLLGWTSGSVMVLFSAMVFGLDLVVRRRFVPSVSSLVVVITCALFVIYCSESHLFASVRHAVLPISYYIKSLDPKVSFYLPLLSLPLTFLLLCFSSILCRRAVVRLSLEFLLVVGLSVWSYEKCYDHKSQGFKMLDYYVRHERWDEVKKYAEGRMTNYMNLSYLNVALSRQGRLVDELMQYEQRGLQGLVMKWNKTFFSSIVLSEVNYAQCNTARTMQMAFEAYVSANGIGSGRMLKRLVETNLIFGYYEVAEKYINILEQTLAYSAWAEQHRKYLFDDAAVLADKELGMRRQLLASKDYLMKNDNQIFDLHQKITSRGNYNYILWNQYFSALLLSKNIHIFEELLVMYYEQTNEEILLPRYVQEALVILYEGNAESLAKHNIQSSIINEFEAFKRQVTAYKNYPNQKQLLKEAFGKSFWYYYLYN